MRLLWHPFLRIALFWMTFFAPVWYLSSSVSILSLAPVLPVVSQILKSDFSGVSRPEFAYSLAAFLVMTGAGFAAAFFFMHALAISVAMRNARKIVEGAPDLSAFSSDYETFYQKLKARPIIGTSWALFDATLIRPAERGTPIRSTVRPQAFINLGAARESLPGLKLMGSIPGYYVGIGLLLTFMGLVFALYNAAAAIDSTDAQAMQNATRGLLHVATFKFATSIAGLGVSIALSFVFRCYTISMERAFDRFDHAVERRLAYAAPQAIAAAMDARMEEQVTQLKEINSERFFSRMGEQMSPRIEAAMSAAVAPVSASIDSAVARMAETSASGVGDLIDKFSTAVQGGAGQELRALAVTLDELRRTLGDAQKGIHGSGEDFGRSISAAAENLNRLVQQSADRLDEGSGKSQAALNEIVAKLSVTFDRTNDNVQQTIGRATEATASRMEEMLGRMFEQVGTQVNSFMESVAEAEKGLGGRIEETSRKVAESQVASVQAVGSAATEAAQALKNGLANALQRVNGEIEVFVRAMSDTRIALAAQSESFKDTTGESRAIADAFHSTAADFRLAAAPLTQAGERISIATERITAAMQNSVAALETTQASSQQLALSLDAQVGQLSKTWEAYSAHFAGVDKDLANAFRQLHETSEALGRRLTEHVKSVDDGLTKAIDKLNPFVSEFSESIEELSASFEKILRPRAAE